MHLINIVEGLLKVKEFLSWQDYWKFSQIIKFENRFIHNEFVQNFLETVLHTCKSRETFHKPGRELWRAQLGNATKKMKDFDTNEEWDEPAPYPPERMIPQRNLASEGRINPKGIPCLYLSSKRDTATAEVRPWKKSLISVGRFTNISELKLVDCSKDLKNAHFFLEEPSSLKKEGSVWADINNAFSKPINPDDLRAEYAPTQIIAELFKNNDYDGIAYKSSYGDGYNIALFDFDTVEMLECFLVELEDISFNFKKLEYNRYTCKKTKERLCKQNA